ncbi:MAG: 16S rRNA (adenine(1518)-N(6)/adenine(1519)-N(6))-dimethyltransferase RsmA [Gammaproteobacteria bacterium]|nr:16S rRNA (adenine(1518)-N(6)/adenine(1519)-N(6))-dimethyltransferase RsmA [Gammaproteobacteria bacterium]
MSEHRARKRFGQNFLHDRGVIERILNAFGPQPGETVVEIGPGLGALTRPLLERIPHLHVVELDRDLAARLRAEFDPTRLTVHEIDALRFNFCSLAPAGTSLRVLGNLPYNISTPILFHLLDQSSCIADMLFMLQKEVVERMVAEPDSTEYGRLSVMLQWRCRIEKLFTVGAGAFTPAPKVESAIVRLVPHAKPPIEVRDAALFARLVQTAFAHRRKTLRNNLKGMIAGEAIAALGIEPERRAETLTLDEFARLANVLAG